MRATRKEVKDFYYYSVGDIVMENGDGVYVRSKDGREFIDCASATFNLILGYGHPEITAIIKEQVDTLIYTTSSFQTDPVNAMVEKLVELSPENLTKVHPKVSGGSVANEGAVKMAQHHTGKRDAISFFRSHLGQTAMMLGMSGNSFRREPFPVIYPGSLQVPDPYCHRCFYREEPTSCGFLCVDRIQDFIEHASTGQVACVIVEPISGNGGNIVPPQGYFQALKKLCDENGIILIFDEIQTAFGRTGEMFAADYFDVQPDIMTVAKGLGGSGMQAAAILTDKKFEGLETHDHAFTFGAQTLAAAAAAKTLEIISRPGFLDNVRVVGSYIMQRLLEMQEKFGFIGDVRGVGLMIGVEVEDSEGNPAVDLTNEIAKRAQDYGLIIRTSQYGNGNVFKIRPPLIITLEEAEMVCNRLERVLEEVS